VCHSLATASLDERLVGVGRYKKWLIGAAVIAALAVGVLAITGTLGSVYRWMVRYFQPEVWSAIAAWFTFAIAVGAFLYAKQQVYQAKQARKDQEKQSGDALKLQAKLARESNEHQAELARKSLEQQAELSRKSSEQQAELARVANEQQAKMLREQITQQADIAQKALDEQARIAQESANDQAKEAQKTRDEMAQPNVIMYVEPNAADWQIQDLVIKNFGKTPAYQVSPIVDTPLQSLPGDDDSDRDFSIVPLPIVIPILAPGQAWTTVWDDATERRGRRVELRREIILGFPGGPPTGTDIDALVSRRMPDSQHTGRVQYFDAKGRAYVTESILNFDLLDGSTRLKTYGIHDIGKKIIEG
jgi:multidrug efflux pump subunit AcrA (membrane-fusion protein)